MSGGDEVKIIPTLQENHDFQCALKLLRWLLFQL